LPYFVKGNRHLKKKENDIGLTGCPVVMHPSAYPILQTFIQGTHNLGAGKVRNDGDKIWEIQKAHPICAQEGDNIKIPLMDGINIEIMHAYHRAHSIGFGFSTITKKLKPGIDKSKIMELKKQGVEITYDQIIPQFIFYGDTTIEALTKHDDWKNIQSS